jgi:hypothetical protein
MNLKKIIKLDKNKVSIVFIISMTLVLSSCQKLVNINPPPTSITSGNVFQTDATATAVLAGIYTKISGKYSTSDFDVSTISSWVGLSADELILWTGADNSSQIAYYKNHLLENSNNSFSLGFWTSFYNNIYSCNSAIEGINQANSLTPAVKKQLLGEAKFLRAYVYFNLVNLFGDVPLVLSTDFKLNSHLVRSSKDLIYQQIIADLQEAKDLLSEEYLKANALTPYSGGTEERIRPTRWSAIAMLARVYLYTQQWMQAEAQSTLVINRSTIFRLTSLNEVFLKNSSETIWALQPVTTGNVTNTQDAYLFIIPPTGPNTYPGNTVYLSSQQLNSFEKNDQRKTNWVSFVTVGSETFYFPFKYKVNTPNSSVTEYLMMLRLGELYLIRSEARAEQNNISGSQDDLNEIRNRAGLLNTIANDKPSLLTAILHERQVELFTELGHRWFDLKRTGKIDEVMNVVTPLKGGTWNKNWQLYPIPLGDIQKNSNLVQNPGY